jgi:hypothetical protein
MSYGSGYGGGYGASTWPDGIRVEVDWSRDGDYTTVGDNVTALVRPQQGAVTAEYGRDQVTALAPTVSGRGSLVLDNRDRRFSPRAATLLNGSANPLYGKIKPARPVKITRTISSTDYVLFLGHTDDNPINPDPELKNVSLSLLDSLADFRGQTISTGLYSGVRTGQAIGYILDACGWSATLRDLDAGATVIPWWWEDGTDALTALEKIIRSEGPPALLTIGADGAIVFKDRHHRLLDSASVTSQGTWRASGQLEPVMQRPFSYDESWTNIVNTGTASVDVRLPQELQPVWTSDVTLSLSAGESKLITASASDPFYGAVAPVAGIDFTVVSGTVNTSLIRSSGASATIIYTAVGAAVITALQLRAQPITVAYTVQVSASDVDSIADFGSRSFPGDLPWCSPDDAQAVLSTAVAQRSQPLPIVSARFLIGRNITKAAAILVRDLSDRVTIIEPETALNNDFYVESIGHELSGVHDHAVTFGLEAIPAGISPMFRFDTTGAGFNDGKFSGGVDDPTTMFLFDDATAGHRFDSGCFAN